jgi:hypothetical protein
MLFIQPLMVQHMEILILTIRKVSINENKASQGFPQTGFVVFII